MGPALSVWLPPQEILPLPELENPCPQEQVCTPDRDRVRWSLQVNVRARSYLNKSTLLSAPQCWEVPERLVTKPRPGQTPQDNLTFHRADFSPVCDRDVFPAFSRNQRKQTVPPLPRTVILMVLPLASLPGPSCGRVG